MYRHTYTWQPYALTQLKIINMKNVLVLMTFAFMISAACGQEKVVNDANAEKRSVGSFHAIEIGGGIDLYLTQSSDEAVAVSASKTEYREKIRTVTENGVLKIYYDNKDWFSFSWTSRRLKAYVSFKTLDRLNGSGGSDITVNGSINQPNLKLGISGGSDFVGRVEVNNLEVNASGGSDVKISGKASKVAIDASGGSDFSGYDLVTETCVASGSGGSDMQITVNKELSVNASGGSDVHYKGSAVIRETKSSGGSSVSKRG